MSPILRRVRLPSLLAGAFLLLVFIAAAAPADSNTIIESIGLSFLAVALLAMAVCAAGFLGRDLKITGITAEVITALIGWGLVNNGLLAAGIYVVLCQGLALAACIFFRVGQPKPERRTRPASMKEADLVGMAAA